MPRPIWSGSISFGLVNVPVQLVTLVRDRSIRLHMLNPEGDCRLRRKLYCPESGQEYDFKETARGFELAPDQYVLIDQEELDALRPDSGKALAITEFVKLASIDPIYFDRSYLLVPGESGATGYRLLVEAMNATGMAAIGRFVMRQRQYLAAIRARDDALLVQTLHYADEVEEPAEVDEVPRGMKAASKELRIAERLIEALSAPFDPSGYRDEYRDRVQELIEAKSEGGSVTVAYQGDEEIPPTYSIAEALEASLKQTAGALRGRDADGGKGSRTSTSSATRHLAAKPRDEGTKATSKSSPRSAARKTAGKASSGGAAKKSSRAGARRKSSSRTATSGDRRRKSA